MRIALFFGAGFSAAFGLPLMKTFFQASNNASSISKEDKELIRVLRKETGQAIRFIDSPPDNLEDVLTFAVMADKTGISDSGGKKRLPEIQRILRAIYSNRASYQDYIKNAKAFLRFVGELKQSFYDSVGIITTNYDMNIEKTLDMCGMKVAKPDSLCETDNSNTSQSIYNKNGIDVCKLHGSINWFVVDEKTVVDDRKAFFNYFGDEPVNSFPLPLAMSDNYMPNGTPLIVPPSFLKTDFNSLLANMWKRAAKILEEAEILIIVGYSFPPTDIEMAYFFARSLTDNIGLNKIIIIDPRANSIVKNIKEDKQVIKYGSHFKSFLTPVEDIWENVKLSPLLN